MGCVLFKGEKRFVQEAGLSRAVKARIEATLSVLGCAQRISNIVITTDRGLYVVLIYSVEVRNNDLVA